MSDTMVMEHEKTKAKKSVTRAAFDAVWKGRGWSEVPTQEAIEQAAAESDVPVTGPGTDYEALTVAQLEAAANLRDDVDLTGATRKPDIIARFTEADENVVPAG